MTHEGRMSRGEKNFNSKKHLDNSETLYYLEHIKKVEKKEVKKK